MLCDVVIGAGHSVYDTQIADNYLRLQSCTRDTPAAPDPTRPTLAVVNPVTGRDAVQWYVSGWRDVEPPSRTPDESDDGVPGHEV
jgi:hypothetical protein